MLERLQSALKTVKDSKPSSMLSHRFVTVRRGSPAARSGQIQPGDQLEAVEGRSVVTLPHRDLAQILRRAGNTLRLTIVPRSTTNSSSLSEATELDAEGRTTRKSHRGRPKQDQRFYNVDLERGPTGFGFSLRGGSEYNMGLYVLGLMEGGPASRSKKIQVSDQLVEINGDSTGGMTHSQAVEQIRRGGHRIHLVLKKGNGYVPDYDLEPGPASPSFSLFPEKPGVAAVDNTHSLPRKGGGKVEKGGGGGEERKGRERKGGSLGGKSSRGGGGGGDRGGGGEDDRDTDLDWLEEDSQVVRSRIRGQRSHDEGRRTQSLPKSALRTWDRYETGGEGEEGGENGEEGGAGGGRQRTKQRTKQRSRDPQSERRRRERERESVYRTERQQSPPSPVSSSETQLQVEGARQGDRETGRGEEESRGSEAEAGGGAAAEEEEEARPAERAPFSFLMPLDAADLSDAESAVSLSEVSVSAASISGVSTAGLPPGLEWKDPWSTARQERSPPRPLYAPQAPVPGLGPSPSPGPGHWLKPSQQKLSQVLEGSRLRGREGGLWS